MNHLPAQGASTRVAVNGEARTDSVDWMSSGACQAEDPELFFPIAMAGPAVYQIGLAKAVCNRCEVRERCLDFAMSTRQDGVWGGTTRDERAAMRLPPAVSADRPGPAGPQ